MLRRLLTQRGLATAAVHAKGGHPKQDFGSFHPPKVSREHKVVAEIFLFYTYFWFFYRFRQDGGSLLNMWHPWDGHDDHGAHGDEHEHH